MAAESGAEDGLGSTVPDHVPELQEPVRIPAWTPPLFFDAAAGLPPSPQCVEWLTASWRTAWADPAGRHEWAGRAMAILGESRARFASLLGCAPSEVWFAPNVDVALSTAATALLAASPSNGSVTASAVERLALLRTLDAVAPAGSLHTLQVAGDGRVDPADPALQAPASLVAVQAANREIGTRQPLAEIRSSIAGRAPLLVDASAIRRLREIPTAWDAIVLEPATWGGPSGIAVVACRSSIPWHAQPPATTTDRFPGRPAVALAAAAAMSLPASAAHEAEEDRIATATDRLADRILRAIPHAQRLGAAHERLGHVLALSLLYVQADQLVDDLARRGMSAQSGSACTSDTKRPSHVLTAIGALTHGNLRISLPPGCTTAELSQLADALVELVGEQRAEAGLA